MHVSSWPQAAFWMTVVVVAGLVLLGLMGALPWQAAYEGGYDEDYEDGEDDPDAA